MVGRIWPSIATPLICKLPPSIVWLPPSSPSRPVMPAHRIVAIAIAKIHKVNYSSSPATQNFLSPAYPSPRRTSPDAPLSPPSASSVTVRCTTSPATSPASTHTTLHYTKGSFRWAQQNGAILLAERCQSIEPKAFR